MPNWIREPVPACRPCASRVGRGIRRGLAGLGLALAVSAIPAPSTAQSYARFAVPDSALTDAVRASGAQFETIWNALLIAELRATLARADSSARLRALSRAVARAEPAALGGRIAADALRLRQRWSPEQCRVRVAAAVDESLGTVAQGARDFVRADSLFGTALRAYRRLGESRRIAVVWGSLGSVAYLGLDMTLADSLYRQALAARRAIGDERLVGNALNTLGSIAYELRRYEQARGFYREARSVREQVGDRVALGTTLNLLGNVALALGERDSAMVFFRAALDATAALGDGGPVHQILNNYALLLRHGEEPMAALPIFERSLAIRRQRGDVSDQAQSLNNIGELLGQSGYYSRALARLSEARTLALAARNVPRLREILVNLGRVAVGLGDPALAREPLERAAALADSMGDRRGESEALTNLGIAARLAGDPTGAARLTERSLAAAVAASDSALIHHATLTLGELALDRGDLEGAERWFLRTLGAGSAGPGQRAADLLNLGAVYARAGRLDAADRHFVEALALSEGGGSPEVSWSARLGRGDVAERRGDHASALRFDRQAAESIERLRVRQGSERPSMRLLARRLFAFEALIHLLTRLQPQYPDSAFAAEAFLWSERARARAFLDLVAAGGGPGRPAPTLGITEAQQLLGSDREAMLVYSLGDSSTSLWVLTRRAWTHVALAARPALRSRIEILCHGLADPAAADARATRAAARALYRALVEPALPLLAGVDRLIIAPDGILARVPFEALLATDPTGDGRLPRRAYVVERYAVSYAPSASALATRMSPARSQRGTGIVALGDPAFGARAAAGEGTALEALPHTAAELTAIAGLAGDRPIVTLSRETATRDRFLALPELTGAALIHLATHGVADEFEPDRSGLWMAAPEHDASPGFLAVPDILGLRLDAELVALSACDTGLGRIERGEGVLGLSRAFLAAGTRSVLVSLWKVNDRSTASLMQEFYQGLLREDATAAIALARAKRALLRSPGTRSPFHWAPFVLVGRAGRLGG